MTIFVQDNGVYGMICVVETTLENAISAMKKCENYDPEEPIVQHEIQPGLVIYNLGDK